MPVTSVKSRWVDGNLVFYDSSMNEIMTFDGANREVSFPSGSKLSVESGASVGIPNGAITSAMLANGAGLAALIAASGGASAVYDKTTTGAQTLLAANGLGEGARSALIVVTVTETFAAGTGAATSFDIGETGTTTKFKAGLNTGTAGDILTFAGSLTEATALLVTATAATGTGTGGISVTVLALPEA